VCIKQHTNFSKTLGGLKLDPPGSNFDQRYGGWQDEEGVQPPTPRQFEHCCSQRLCISQSIVLTLNFSCRLFWRLKGR